MPSISTWNEPPVLSPHVSFQSIPPNVVVGPILVGMALTLISFGLILGLYSSYFRDWVHVKVLLSFLVIIGSAQALALLDAAWFFLVHCWGRPLLLYGYEPKQLPCSIGLVYTFTTLAAFPVQCFYIHRIYKLSESIFVTFQVFLFALVAFGAGLTASIIETTKRLGNAPLLPHNHDDLDGSILTWVYLGATCLTDIGIAIAMLCILFARRTQVVQSSFLCLVVKMVLETGFALAATSIALMICSAASPTTNLWMVFAFPFGNVYIISLLVTLNARKSFQKEDVEPQSMDNNEMQESSNTAGRPIERCSAIPAGKKATTTHLDIISVDNTPRFLQEDAYSSVRRQTKALSPTALVGVNASQSMVSAACASSRLERSTSDADKGKGKASLISHESAKPVFGHRQRSGMADADAAKRRVANAREVSSSLKMSHQLSSVEKPKSTSLSTSPKKPHKSSSFSSLMKRNHPPPRESRGKAALGSSDANADTSSERIASSDMSFHCRGTSMECGTVHDKERARSRSTELRLDIGLPCQQWDTSSEDWTNMSTSTACLTLDHQQSALAFAYAVQAEEICVGRTSTLSYEPPSTKSSCRLTKQSKQPPLSNDALLLPTPTPEKTTSWAYKCVQS